MAPLKQDTFAQWNLEPVFYSSTFNYSILDIQIPFSINYVSQLFTFGKFLMSVSQSFKEKL